MAITAAVVNELRQATGCGLMDCKKALIECEGDIEGREVAGDVPPDLDVVALLVVGGLGLDLKNLRT